MLVGGAVAKSQWRFGPPSGLTGLVSLENVGWSQGGAPIEKVVNERFGNSNMEHLVHDLPIQDSDFRWLFLLFFVYHRGKILIRLIYRHHWTTMQYQLNGIHVLKASLCTSNIIKSKTEIVDLEIANRLFLVSQNHHVFSNWGVHHLDWLKPADGNSMA